LSTFRLKSLSMKFRDYIERTHVFTNQQLVESCTLSAASVKTVLKRAVEAGSVERVRRGLYVSRAGGFAVSDVDPFELVSALDAEAVLSFHSALEAHGIAHNVSSTCQFRSAAVKGSFEYSGIAYVPFAFTESAPMQKLRGRSGLRITATTREQTIIDCLNHPERCGGMEEALMSISLFPYIDTNALLGLVSEDSASLAARVGWLLEQKADDWRIPGEALEKLSRMTNAGPYKLDKNSRRSQGWSRRWKLCLPAYEEEVKRWVL
jgi:predicted transcriptional regulator of viral defense system